MLRDINYLNLKNLIIKYYKGSNIYIETTGVINTRYCIEKAKVSINKHKLVILNDDLDCTILLDFIKRLKLREKYHIELFYEDFRIVLEI